VLQWQLVVGPVRLNLGRGFRAMQQRLGRA
jgi:hypothetical protein